MKIIFHGEFTDLNTYINANRTNRYAGNDIKQSETTRIFYACKKQKIKPVRHYPVTVGFNWYCKNERKDLDNVAFSKKFVLDGLVVAKILKNDSRRFICGFTDKFFIDKADPRVEVEIK